MLFSMPEKQIIKDVLQHPHIFCSMQARALFETHVFFVLKEISYSMPNLFIPQLIVFKENSTRLLFNKLPFTVTTLRFALLKAVPARSPQGRGGLVTPSRSLRAAIFKNAPAEAVWCSAPVLVYWQ